jgi:hypothetical protein
MVDGTSNGKLDGAKEDMTNGISDGSRSVGDLDGVNVSSNMLPW